MITHQRTLGERFVALSQLDDPDKELGEIQELAWYIKQDILRHISQREIDYQITNYMSGYDTSSTPYRSLFALTKIRCNWGHRIESWLEYELSCPKVLY